MHIHLEFHVHSTNVSTVINYTGKEYLVYLKKISHVEQYTVFRYKFWILIQKAYFSYYPYCVNFLNFR